MNQNKEVINEPQMINQKSAQTHNEVKARSKELIHKRTMLRNLKRLCENELYKDFCNEFVDYDQVCNTLSLLNQDQEDMKKELYRVYQNKRYYETKDNPLKYKHTKPGRPKKVKEPQNEDIK